MASATGKDVRDVGALSVQQLAFCGKQLRACSSDWTLEGALAQLAEGGALLLEECLPYKPDYRQEQDAASHVLGHANVWIRWSVPGQGPSRVWLPSVFFLGTIRS